MKTYTLIVRGRVQGVGFRYTAHQLAQSLGLVGGLFKNMDDGSVLVEVSGSEDALEAFVLSIENDKQGFSKVSSVDVDKTTEVIHTSFMIR